MDLDRLPAALFEIGKLIGSDLDPGVLLSRIAELICELIDAKACSVMLLDADRKRLIWTLFQRLDAANPVEAAARNLEH